MTIVTMNMVSRAMMKTTMMIMSDDKDNEYSNDDDDDNDGDANQYDLDINLVYLSSWVPINQGWLMDIIVDEVIITNHCE